MLEQVPGDVAFARLLLNALQRAGLEEELADSEHLLAPLPAAVRFDVLLRAKLERRDYAGIGRVYAEHAGELGPAAADSLATVVNQLIQGRHLEQAVELLDQIETPVSPSPKLVTAATGVYLGRARWDAADRWLSAVEERVADDERLRVRRLQLLCSTLRLEEAQSVLAGWEGPADLPPMATVCAATLYASLGQWDNVIVLLEDRVRRGLPVPGDFLEVVALAARATRRYEDVFDLLADAVETQPTLESENLGDRLAVEVAVLDVLGALDGEAPAATPPIRKRIFQDRAALFARLLAAEPRTTRPRRPAATSRPGGAIVLCADSNYLLGTCVAVSSLLANNRGVTGRHRVLVVCSEGSIELGEAALGAIAAAKGENVEVLPAEEILPPGGVEGLRSGWGWFTPGHALSDAAYYRLFAIRHLLESGVSGRALYLDSDTCIGTGVDEFWEFDLKRRPLGARYELKLLPIEQAALKLGLDPATYFNSGVLLFNLGSKKLAELVDSSIEIAVRDADKLSFLDQCALNVAFAGKVAPLEDRHNFYVRPNDDVDRQAKPVVRHFLSRWKPWDPTYPSKNSQPWLRELSRLGGIVPRQQLEQLLSAQYASSGPGTALLAEAAPV